MLGILFSVSVIPADSKATCNWAIFVRLTLLNTREKYEKEAEESAVAEVLITRVS